MVDPERQVYAVLLDVPVAGVRSGAAAADLLALRGDLLGDFEADPGACLAGGPSLRRPGRRITSAQPGFWPASHSRPSLSSLRERGSTDRNRPPWPAMWFMFAVVASLLSATYKNPGCPAIARQACQVAMWVVESSVFPSAILKVNGTAPSAQVVKIHTSCFRSGRWSLECPRAGRAGPAPPPGAGPSCGAPPSGPVLPARPSAPQAR